MSSLTDFRKQLADFTKAANSLLANTQLELKDFQTLFAILPFGFFYSCAPFRNMIELSDEHKMFLVYCIRLTERDIRVPCMAVARTLNTLRVRGSPMVVEDIWAGLQDFMHSGPVTIQVFTVIPNLMTTSSSESHRN